MDLMYNILGLWTSCYIYEIKYILYSWCIESDIRLVQWYGTGCKASGRILEETGFEWIFRVTELCFVIWKVYSQSVVTPLDLAEEGRSGMFLFDCCPTGWPMSKMVRGCYRGGIRAWFRSCGQSRICRVLSSQMRTGLNAGYRQSVGKKRIGIWVSRKGANTGTH